MSIATATSTAPDTDAQATPAADDQFAAIPCEYQVEKRPSGEIVVKDVPVFAENERKSLGPDAKYDDLWLKRAAKIDGDLRMGAYRAPMHFGHHTFAGGQLEAAGHYELTGVRKCKLHGKKLHVSFADLVFKNEAKFEKYRTEYPYRSVEISHERPEQINSLALLSAEAPYFQFPMGNHKFGTEVGAEAPKAHYFAWHGEGLETFAGFPASGKKKAFQPPKYGEGEDEAASEAGDVSDGADGLATGGQPKPGQPPAPAADPGTNNNDVILAQINALSELLNKLVDHVIRKDEHGAPGGTDLPHQEPDGDEGDNDGDDTMADEKDKKKQPIVSASADVATLQGTVDALQAKIAQMEREQAQREQFAALKAELAPYGIDGLDAKLLEHVKAGDAASWASGIKLVAPTKRPTEAPGATGGAPEDPALAEFLKQNPKVDSGEARRLAAVYAAAPEGTPEGDLIRKWPLDKFIAVQLEMGG